MKSIALLLLLALAISQALASAAPDLSASMPRAEDDTQMFWTHGFPKVVTGAPWTRAIETGRYAMVLDTEKLAVPHLGGVDTGELMPAELTLSVTRDGTRYRCIGAKPWTRFTGPRLVESGRFFQRGDVTDLIFKNEAGERLDIKARLETAAWPDRLGLILITEPSETVSIRLTRGDKALNARVADTGRVSLALDPVTFTVIDPADEVQVSAADRPVRHEPGLGWHRINLDGIVPARANSNDAMERIPFTLTNPTDREQVARLMFEKTRGGIKQRIGSPITGLSAVLRDAEGNPTGVPVQLSKNWHNKPEGGAYAGQWLHAITQVRLPAGAKIELELVIVYGHWGGVAAASHAQLSLIGWGGNQRWDESALGSWGESICYDPEQAQAQCSITDVRPLMVTPKNGKGKWNWTNNVGGGDFFRLFDAKGTRVPHAGMRADYHRYGPCLTEVTYSGRIGEGIRHSETVSLNRSDDIVRGTYRIRLDIGKAHDFSRFVIFQLGADTYNFTREGKFAYGDINGVKREWLTKPGGDLYKAEPTLAPGPDAWVSLHYAKRRPGGDENGAWATRGLVVREWEARLGGKPAAPHIAERSTTRHRQDYSTLDFVPPPNVKKLLPGDFVEATLQYLVFPQKAADYYGPNEALRTVLKTQANRWQITHREVAGNARAVTVKRGTLIHRFPDLRIKADSEKAVFEIASGLGHVPITISGLSGHAGYVLTIDGKPVDQSVHGKDFWQTDYDPKSRRWSQTFNVPLKGKDQHTVEFRPAA